MSLFTNPFAFNDEIQGQLWGLHGIKTAQPARSYSDDETKRVLGTSTPAFEPPPSVQNVVMNMTSLHGALKKHAPALFKEKNRFVNAFISQQTEDRFDAFLRRFKKRRAANHLDWFSKVDILHPTEMSVNLLNMFTNHTFVYSSFTPREPDEPAPLWSGGHLHYLHEKYCVPIEECIYILAILEAMTYFEMKKDFAVQFVRENCPKVSATADQEMIDNNIYQAFELFTDQLHHNLLKSVNITFLTRQVLLFIDYVNAFNYVPLVRRGFVSRSQALMNQEPALLIPEMHEFAVVDQDGTLHGFHFETGRSDTMLVQRFSPQEPAVVNLYEMELKLSDLRHAYVRGCFPYRYIVTEIPENKKESELKTLADLEKEDKEFGKDLQQAKMTEYRLAAMRERRDAKTYQAEMHQKLVEMKRKNFVESQEAKMELVQQKESEREKRRAHQLKKESLRLSRDALQLDNELLKSYTKNLQRLIESRSKMDEQDEKTRQHLIEQHSSTMAKTSTILDKLLSTMTLSHEKLIKNGEIRHKDDSGMLSANLLTRLSDTIGNVLETNKALSQISSIISMDVSDSVPTTARLDSSAQSAVGLITNLENKVNAMMGEILSKWTVDVEDSIRRNEEIYQKIGRMIDNVENSDIPGEHMFKYNEAQTDFVIPVAPDADDELIKAIDSQYEIANDDGHDGASTLRDELSTFIKMDPNTKAVTVTDKAAVPLFRHLKQRYINAMKACNSINEASGKLQARHDRLQQDFYVKDMENAAVKKCLADAKVVNDMLTKSLKTSSDQSERYIRQIKNQLDSLSKQIERNRSDAAKDAEKELQKMADFFAQNKKEFGEIKQTMDGWKLIDAQLALKSMSRDAYTNGFNEDVTKLSELKEKLVTDIQAADARLREGMQQEIASMKNEAAALLLASPATSSSIPGQVREKLAEMDSSDGGGGGKKARTAGPELPNLSELSKIEKKWAKRSIEFKEQAIRAAQNAWDAQVKMCRLEQKVWSDTPHRLGREDAPDRFAVSGLYRAHQLSKTVNKQDVEYLQTTLSENWQQYAQSKFMEIKVTTKTGTSWMEKNLSHSFFSYILPCFKIIYESNLELDNYHTLLKSKTKNSKTALKDILLARGVLNQLAKEFCKSNVVAAPPAPAASDSPDASGKKRPKTAPAAPPTPAFSFSREIGDEGGSTDDDDVIGVVSTA